MNIERGKPKDILKLYIKELSAWGYFLDGHKPFKQEVKKLTKQLKISTNKIGRKKEEYKFLTKDKKKDQKPLTLMEQKVKLQLALKRDINIMVCSVSEWVYSWNEVELINQQVIRQALKNNK